MDWKIELLVVPVTDIDRAKAFYADQLGFHVDLDVERGDFRIVQLTPAGSGCSIAIGTGLVDMAPGALRGMQICVGDIDAAHAQLVERGVDVTPVRHKGPDGWAEGHGEDWNSFVFFDDPDGNSWAIQESPTMHAALQAERAGVLA
jgi:catechol 2,3-dioxygenase-like lactoylglutathione lyase family enzyme